LDDTPTSFPQLDIAIRGGLRRLFHSLVIVGTFNVFAGYATAV
jgi:hypothetical protein